MQNHTVFSMRLRDNKFSFNTQRGVVNADVHSSVVRWSDSVFSFLGELLL